jgi:hypothetical protein
MCLEQSEFITHVFSMPLSITYIGREEVNDSMLGLVR